MVWALRICLAALVLAYAAWLALPPGTALAAGVPLLQVWSDLAPVASVPAATLAGMFLAIVALYGTSGVATTLGLNGAPGLFFLGFVGEIAVRLVIAGGTPTVAPTLDIAARVESALRPFGVLVETTPLALAALLAVGLCILVTGVWRGQTGAALTRIWTQPPVYA